MADSENSTSLCPVSRRTLLGGAITIPFISVPNLAPGAKAMDDPILTLWQDWQSAFGKSAACSARWGALEAALVRAVGFPRVLIPLSPSTREVWVSSHEQIDDELEDMPDADELRQRLHSDLTDRKAKWDAAAESVDLNAADRQVEAAWSKAEEIADALFALPARGFPGVIAKLELVLRMGESRADDEEFPWGQLRSTVADLRRLIIGEDAPEICGGDGE